MTPSPRAEQAQPGRGAAAAGAWPAGVAGAVSSATEVPPSEAAGQAQGERPVQDDGGEDQGADGGVAPERVEPSCGSDVPMVVSSSAPSAAP